MFKVTEFIYLYKLLESGSRLI